MCASNGIYDVKGFENGTIDQWDYEEYLPSLFDALKMGCSTTLDGFVHSLVPFVTCLFVRGPDFEQRMNARMFSGKIESSVFSRDNANADRVFEIQRLLSIMLVSDWSCLHSPENRSFVLGDLGITQTDIEGRPAWIVPVDPSLAIMIRPRKKGQIATFNQEHHMWLYKIRHLQLHEGALRRVNQSSMSQCQDLCMALSRQDFIGPLPERSLKDKLAESTEAFGLASYFSVNEMIEHEFEWYGLSLIAARNLSPTMAKRLTKNRPYRDLNLNRWMPQMPMIPENIRFFDSGVSIEKRKMILDLSETDDFEKHLCEGVLQTNIRQMQ
ncbi:hypothetical protein [Bifidobacterium crudilactis]|uniref:hypothetical protein n=1 Tax=Bifidobacterium crudilactis TaxID=327277 RepID=UPI00055298C2|nr:hypothetical protein [Bifidobacterium crudilactis]